MSEVTAALTQVRRAPERGTDDALVVRDILDAGLVAHLGYVVDGRPVVIPTMYGRDGDALVLHGSAASRAMRHGAAQLPVCVTVTLLDGLVLARSAMHQSANYRSVVVHGDATEVTDPDAKRQALRVLTDHVAPGRWEEIRQPDARELRATTVLRLPLTHAVAKVRGHGVVDDTADLDRPVWAGVVPLLTALGPPRSEPGAERFALPAAVAAATVRGSSSGGAAGRPTPGAPASVLAPAPAHSPAPLPTSGPPVTS